MSATTSGSYLRDIARARHRRAAIYSLASEECSRGKVVKESRMSDVESKGRANTPAGCARSVGFAADLRRGSLCGVQRGVHARGCGARCTRRARQPCAAPVSVTGLEGKRESGPSSEKCNQPVMIIGGQERGIWDDRLCSTLFQTVVLQLICC